jgi:DNA gyrase/topoisomerase IV subunit B
MELSVVNALSNHLRATVHTVMVRFMSKNTKKESVVSSKLEKQLKRNDCNFYPDQLFLLKLQSIHTIRSQHVCVNVILK